MIPKEGLAQRNKNLQNLVLPQWPQTKMVCPGFPLGRGILSAHWNSDATGISGSLTCIYRKKIFPVCSSITPWVPWFFPALGGRSNGLPRLILALNPYLNLPTHPHITHDKETGGSQWLAKSFTKSKRNGVSSSEPDSVHYTSACKGLKCVFKPFQCQYQCGA